MNRLYVKTRPGNGKTQPYSIAKQNREYLFLPELNDGRNELINRQLVRRMKQSQT